MKQESKVAIFTLTKDRLEYTQRMLRSLERFTHIPYDHFVIDNGSTDGTVEFLKSRPGRIVDTIFNQENKGLSIGWNQALDMIGDDYDFIIKIDNDCEILTDDWLEPILEIMKAFDNKIVMSPYVEGLREHKGGVPRYARKIINGHRIGLTKHLGGIALVAPAEAYGGFRFDEKLPLKGNQDVTFSASINRLGYLLGYVEDLRVVHMDTTDGQHKKYPNYFKHREVEMARVYGEQPILTRIKKPYRDWLFRHRVLKSIKR